MSSRCAIVFLQLSLTYGLLGFGSVPVSILIEYFFGVTFVRMERLELSNLAALDPKSSVSTNSTTRVNMGRFSLELPAETISLKNDRD